MGILNKEGKEAVYAASFFMPRDKYGNIEKNKDKKEVILWNNN